MTILRIKLRDRDAIGTIAINLNYTDEANNECEMSDTIDIRLGDLHTFGFSYNNKEVGTGVCNHPYNRFIANGLFETVKEDGQKKHLLTSFAPINTLETSPSLQTQLLNYDTVTVSNNEITNLQTESNIINKNSNSASIIICVMGLIIIGLILAYIYK